MNEPLEEFRKAIDAFLALPMEEQVRRLEEAEKWAKEISDKYDSQIRLDPEFLRMPMTI